MKTARERAERALRHAPIISPARWVIICRVEQEIIEGVEEALESHAIAGVDAPGPNRRAVYGPEK